jgi:hypothetical protein
MVFFSIYASTGARDASGKPFLERMPTLKTKDFQAMESPKRGFPDVSLASL